MSEWYAFCPLGDAGALRLESSECHLKGDYERIKARGAEFTMPPTDVTGSTIAMLNDTCGNLIQLTQLARYSR